MILHCYSFLFRETYLAQLEVNIKERSDFLCKKAQEFGFLENSPITGDEWFQNNSVAINAAKAIPRCIQESYSFSNSNETPVLKVFGNEKFLIPSLSTFHLCDISSLDSLKGEKFNLILMDPPWVNKGVKRKKGYNTLHHTLLDSLPIEELCLHGSLIAVWVTNNSTQINYVKEVLFPKWKIHKSTLWHWTKVTQKGNYVHPFGWHHKKPYENLLLGFHNTEQITHCIQEFTDHKVIVSIPSSVHSQKPPLAEILEPYLPENPKCLELFARYLIPSWTSVGNEVLKLQNIKLFEVPDS